MIRSLLRLKHDAFLRNKIVVHLIDFPLKGPGFKQACIRYLFCLRCIEEVLNGVGSWLTPLHLIPILFIAKVDLVIHLLVPEMQTLRCILVFNLNTHRRVLRCCCRQAFKLVKVFEKQRGHNVTYRAAIDELAVEGYCLPFFVLLSLPE